jgi:hypothetical protein
MGANIVASGLEGVVVDSGDDLNVEGLGIVVEVRFDLPLAFGFL